VLQILLAERVSIRDLATILEGIADGLGTTRNPAIAGRARPRPPRRQLCAQHTSGRRSPADHRAHRQMGAGLCRIDRRPGRRPQPRHAALKTHRVSINLVREKFEQAARDGEAPVLVTSPGIRPAFVRG